MLNFTLVRVLGLPRTWIAVLLVVGRALRELGKIDLHSRGSPIASNVASIACVLLAVGVALWAWRTGKLD